MLLCAVSGCQVCGVNPGRELELQTVLGLVRARSMLEQQQPMAYNSNLQQRQQISRSLSNRGIIKTARCVCVCVCV